MPPGRKSRYGKLTPCDWISDLPSSIIESILMCLPTRDAARTSILSRKWRFKWTTVPQLILDDTFWNMSTIDRPIPKEKFVKVFYQILSLHQGPIHKFVLDGLKSCPEIDNLIVLLSRSGIQELTLNLRSGERYKMPSSVFSCQELRQLNLMLCVISPPTSFKGFSQLIALTLHEVEISAKVLGSLISSCPVLEILEVKVLENLFCVEIDAPKLKSLIFYSPTRYIFFKNTPVLAMLALLAGEDGGLNFPAVGKGIIHEFFRLPSLENLHLDYHFIKTLSADAPAGAITSLIGLKVLRLTNISMNVVNEMPFFFFLLRSCPNLQQIDISAYCAIDFQDISGIPDTLDISNVTLNELREVKLLKFSGTMIEMDVIQILLERSPILEKLVIEPMVHPELYPRENVILRSLNKYRRASPKAKVVYQELCIE